MAVDSSPEVGSEPDPTDAEPGKGVDEAQREVLGAWYRSHEEEAGGAEVYHPASYSFPPTRMPRQSFRLTSDHVLEWGRPGPADRNEYRTGSWRLNGREVVLDLGDRQVRLVLDEEDPGSPVLRTP